MKDHTCVLSSDKGSASSDKWEHGGKTQRDRGLDKTSSSLSSPQA